MNRYARRNLNWEVDTPHDLWQLPWYITVEWNGNGWDLHVDEGQWRTEFRGTFGTWKELCCAVNSMMGRPHTPSH